MSRPVITLTTDFGLTDSYVAQMKGVMLSLCPNVEVIDISHLVPPHSIMHGARLLQEAAPRFPEGTIHLAVVDPGVGSSRRGVVIAANIPGTDETQSNSVLCVGPDNGLFSLLATKANRRGAWEISRLDHLPRVDQLTTFDGRDVFAPVAALLAGGKEPSFFGDPIEADTLEELVVPEPLVQDDGTIAGEILHFDHFGNAVTNIPGSLLGSGAKGISLPEIQKSLDRVRSYEQIDAENAAALIGSQGFLEIAANKRSAKELLRLTVGMKVVLRPY